jgi:hypothetical protein
MHGTRQLGNLIPMTATKKFTQRFSGFLGPRLYNNIHGAIDARLSRKNIKAYLIDIGVHESERLLTSILA